MSLLRHFLTFLTITVFSCAAVDIKTLIATDPDLAGYNDLFKSNPEALDLLASYKNATLFLSNTETFKRNAAKIANAKANPDMITLVVQEVSVNGTYTTSSFAGRGLILRTNLVGPPSVSNYTDGTPIKAQNKIVSSGRATRSKITRANIQYDNGLVHILDDLINMPVSFYLTSILIKNVGLAVAEAFVTASGNRPPPPKKETFIAYTPGAYLDSAYLGLYRPAKFLVDLNAYQVINTTIVYGPEVPESGISVPTVLGPSLSFTTNRKGKLFINGIKTVQQDILVSNGVLHIVPKVLAPPGTNLTVPDSSIVPPTEDP